MLQLEKERERGGELSYEITFHFSKLVSEREGESLKLKVNVQVNVTEETKKKKKRRGGALMLPSSFT